MLLQLSAFFDVHCLYAMQNSDLQAILTIITLAVRIFVVEPR
jgi:hypothetical protein